MKDMVQLFDRNAKLTMVSFEAIKEYEMKQLSWMANNKIGIGVIVRATREAEDFEQGWGNSWPVDSMNVLEEELEVVGYGAWGIEVRLANGIECDLPYFVLEVVQNKES